MKGLVVVTRVEAHSSGFVAQGRQSMVRVTYEGPGATLEAVIGPNDEQPKVGDRYTCTITKGYGEDAA